MAKAHLLPRVRAADNANKQSGEWASPLPSHRAAPRPSILAREYRMMLRPLALLGVAVFALPSHRAAGAEGPIFERDVRPIFKAYCLDCHGGGEKLEGNLDLRLARFAAKGGDSGPAIVAGKPAESLLDPAAEVRRDAAGREEGSRRADRHHRAVDRRRSQGRPRRARAACRRASTSRPRSAPTGSFSRSAGPSRRAAQPNDRVRTPIDAFVLAKLREKGLAFAADADKRTLMRRAAIDLTGLPPTPEEVDAVPGRHERRARTKRLVDRLLASPHYGERWGRHWLDVAGYADSDGDGTTDTLRPYAYKYRDYVIRALNADKPLESSSSSSNWPATNWCRSPGTISQPEQIEKLAATGFLRMAVDGTQGTAGEQEAANQVVADTIKIVSSSLLGLTVGCAQCHDHRYDPIPQADYFRLRAVFEPALDTGALAAAQPAAGVALHRRRPREGRRDRSRGRQAAGGARTRRRRSSSTPRSRRSW